MKDRANLGATEPAKSRAEYLVRWSQLHGGLDPRASRIVSGWLVMSYALGRPLARVGFSPNGITSLGLLVAASVPLFAWYGTDGSQSGWLWLAVLMCALAGLVDSLDGVVAVVTGRTSAWGYVYDSVADRISDCAILSALWFAGAPGVIVVGAGILTFAQEYSRARAGAGGMSEVGVISIWERPTRIIVVAVFVGLCAWAPYGISSPQWATFGAALALVLSLVGLTQVLIGVRRRLG